MPDLLIRYFSALWSLFADLWFYMVFGFILAAAVNEFVSSRRILSYFGGNDIFSLLRATFAGFLVSSCSCGALSLASTFRKRGASTATLLTFLLAAPWAGLPMVFVFIKFLGLAYTLLLMIAGLAVAFLSGTILAVLEKRRIIEQPVGVLPRMEGGEECAECVEDAERAHRGEPLPRRVFVHVPLHVREIFLDIGKYMVIGLFLGAFLKAFIPAGTVVEYLGRQRGFLAILTALPLSVVIEACSEGFAIIAGQLYVMGASLSVVFVMTMVGVTTDLTEILVVWSRIGRRATIAQIIVGTVLTVLAAAILLVL